MKKKIILLIIGFFLMIIPFCFADGTFNIDPTQTDPNTYISITIHPSYAGFDEFGHVYDSYNAWKTSFGFACGNEDDRCYQKETARLFIDGTYTGEYYVEIYDYGLNDGMGAYLSVPFGVENIGTVGDDDAGDDDAGDDDAGDDAAGDDDTAGDDTAGDDAAPGGTTGSGDDAAPGGTTGSGDDDTAGDDDDDSGTGGTTGNGDSSGAGDSNLRLIIVFSLIGLFVVVAIVVIVIVVKKFRK